MVKVYRERLEIAGSILQTALKPSTSYELLVASSTSYKRLVALHEALLVTGDIVEVPNGSGKKYKTSSQGAEFLRKINDVKPNMERVKKALAAPRI